MSNPTLIKNAESPTWQNDTEYQNFGDPQFVADEAEYRALIDQLIAINQTKDYSLDVLVNISGLRERAGILGGNLSTFTNCELAVDAQNAEARRVGSRLQRLGAEFSAALVPAHHALLNADEVFFKSYLARVPSEAFSLGEARARQDLLLDPEEEQILATFKPFGLRAWGDLYDQISGGLKISVEGVREVGLAQAQSYLRDASPALRRSAWSGIQAAWRPHKESVAAVLNALAGFRLEEYRQRSKKRTLDFLDVPLNQSRIQRETLSAMHAAIDTERPLVARALTAMAKALGQEKLDAWDLSAPAPGDAGSYAFGEGLTLVRDAFAKVDPEMGAFVTKMFDQGWIEARVRPNKRGGAFCTRFPKSKTPRVFQTFLGSYQDVSTLAHELGHAWHNWVMRDLPAAERSTPMTLAETASVFAETALGDHAAEISRPGTKLAIAYAEVSDAVTFLANIRARFEFESTFYKERARGALSADELSGLMERAFKRAYGNALGETENQFWMTKLHFSIASVSFYNFPYTFGYLFSQGIYEQRRVRGDNFSAMYRNLLTDTGRMSAEDLVLKHLGADIRRPEFWLESLKVVGRKVANLERLLGVLP